MNTHGAPSQRGAIAILGDPAHPTRAWARQHATALAAAVGGVAGRKEARRAAGLGQRLASCSRLSDADLAQLRRLHRMLSREFAGGRATHQLTPAAALEVGRMASGLAALLQQCEECRRWAEAWSGSSRPSPRNSKHMATSGP